MPVFIALFLGWETFVCDVSSFPYTILNKYFQQAMLQLLPISYNMIVNEISFQHDIVIEQYFE